MKVKGSELRFAFRGKSGIQLALSAGREEGIDERLEALLRMDAIHGGALNLLTRRLLADGTDLDRAEELARRAVRFAGSPETLETLGLASLEQGDNLRALRAFATAVDTTPIRRGSKGFGIR